MFELPNYHSPPRSARKEYLFELNTPRARSGNNNSQAITNRSAASHASSAMQRDQLIHDRIQESKQFSSNYNGNNCNNSNYHKYNNNNHNNNNNSNDNNNNGHPNNGSNNHYNDDSLSAESSPLKKNWKQSNENVYPFSTQDMKNNININTDKNIKYNSNNNVKLHNINIIKNDRYDHDRQETTQRLHKQKLETQLPAHALNPHQSHVYPKAQLYRLRQEYDKWGQIEMNGGDIRTLTNRSHYTDSNNSNNSNHSNHSNSSNINDEMERYQRQEQMRQTWKNQILEHENKLKEIKQAKERERDEMLKKLAQIENDKKNEQLYKLEKQKEFENELNIMNQWRQQLSENEKEKRENETKLLMNKWKRDEKIAIENEMQKKAREKAIWEQMIQDCNEKQINKEKKLQQEKLRDLKYMEEYENILEKEELRRNNFLKSVARSQNAREDEAFKILQMEKEKQAIEDERLQYYNKLNNEKYKQNMKKKQEKMLQQQMQFKQYLDQQLNEKQKQRQIEIDKAKLERLQLEKQLIEIEQIEQRKKQEQMQSISQYRDELLEQAHNDVIRRIKQSYQLTDVEKAINHQFLQ